MIAGARVKKILLSYAHWTSTTGNRIALEMEYSPIIHTEHALLHNFVRAVYAEDADGVVMARRIWWGRLN